MTHYPFNFDYQIHVTVNGRECYLYEHDARAILDHYRDEAQVDGDGPVSNSNVSRYAWYRTIERQIRA
jgi:hypothetical protein